MDGVQTSTGRGDRGASAVSRTGRAVVAALAAIAAVAAYALLAWTTRDLVTIADEPVAYLPAGLALGLTVAWGWPAVPVLFAGELAARATVLDAGGLDDRHHVVHAAAVGIVWGAAAAVIRRASDVRGRRLPADVVLALVAGAAAAPLAVALAGAGVERWAAVDGGPFLDAAGRWWVREAAGAVSLAPVVLAAAWWRRAGVRWFATRSPVAVVAELAAPTAVAAGALALSADGSVLPYSAVVPAVLVALRYGVVGAAVATAGLAPLLTRLADIAGAPVERGELQAVVLAAGATALVVGAVTTERERLGRLHRELSDVVERTPDLVTIVEADGRVRYLNPAARAVAGLRPTDDVRALRDVDLTPDAVDAESIEQARRQAQREGQWAGDVRLRSVDGRELAGSKVVVSHPGARHERTRTTAIVRDLTEQRRLQHQLARRGLYDDVTGLPNRALLVERIEHARRRDRQIVLLLAVIERFAVVTEGLGHHGGDAVVREVGRRLVERLAPSDTVARLGHETFGILVDHDVDEVVACTIGDRLVAEVAGHLELHSRPVPLSISIGAAADADVRGTDELLRAAEVAARRAMEVGGARTVLYTDRTGDASRHRLDAEGELRDAIDQGRWWLAYQPIIDLRTDRVVSCEALLRWTDSSGRPVPPYEFIGLAEETGLIVPLGRSVLERACLDALGWADHGERVTVSVNVSPRQLTEPGFTESVAEVLERTGTDPGVVTVDLTETSFSSDPSTVGPLLDALDRLGVEVAMDDFGTGYSSLAQLGDLPLSDVKLDTTFIEDLATSRRCRELVQGVITLGHALGLTVVAEGVEDEEQLRILRELGCDRAQGYLIARPSSPEELRDRLEPDAPPPDDDLDRVTRALLDRYG